MWTIVSSSDSREELNPGFDGIDAMSGPSGDERRAVRPISM
jgi:hypothetical protein